MAWFSKSTKTPWRHVMRDAKEDSHGMVIEQTVPRVLSHGTVCWVIPREFFTWYDGHLMSCVEDNSHDTIFQEYNTSWRH